MNTDVYTDWKSTLSGVTANRVVFMTIFVSALGYFVDVFDLILFSVVRTQSLLDLGVPEPGLLSAGVRIINFQMAGMLMGGIFWGITGDKLGRLSVLFASILLYSVANIANAYVTTVEQYGWLRLISGFGLAGELGVGVTLASELLPKSIRGVGTAFISGLGFLGGISAALASQVFDWQTSYIIGGVLGLLLLILRINVVESGLFQKIKKCEKEVCRGKIWMLFSDFAMFKKYLAVILIGAPIWATLGLFVTFTPEFAKDFGMTVLPTSGQAVLFYYLGGSIGSISSGVISQYLQSRRKTIGLFLGITAVSMLLPMVFRVDSLTFYYAMCVVLGFGSGYWAMFIQVGAEQFGTNIRATAATTVPNFVRGLTIPMTTAFRAMVPAVGVTMSGAVVIGGAILLAFASLAMIHETFHKDLDYVEE